ncbi:MAG: ACT domain-containing protein [Clostridia bacterium]|nr:ACT domain-containing protein [Clostridia bacterium]
MKAVITVVGKDRSGIIAEVSMLLYRGGVNIEDISQTIMQDLFTMIMMADISEATMPFEELKDALDKLGERLGVEIRIQLEDIFNSMHRI